MGEGAQGGNRGARIPEASLNGRWRCSWDCGRGARDARASGEGEFGAATTESWGCRPTSKKSVGQKMANCRSGASRAPARGGCTFSMTTIGTG